ncbi:chromosomal replication initiator protein DnaA [Actinomyces sp. zg-332]|uniref:chromosomal replication initiator protein DnaA n=1 Tax=Actinomyces sp. zg-332 TaxID=2708340 RepID=UPI00141D844A|nr:chromosomal replication initiator protein DnaA [Actinomyces sp. zg-332]QPK94147.1 chromosomal replication initiator protein DnaA [Actinomyces sp. zg-332]
MSELSLSEIWDEYIKIQSPTIGLKETGFLNLCRLIGDIATESIVLLTPNDYIKEHIEKNYKESIIIFITSRINSQISVFSILVDKAISSIPSVQPDSELHLDTLDFEPKEESKILEEIDNNLENSQSSEVIYYDKDSHLNLKYTFDHFIIGNSNRFAQAAAIAVSEEPGSAYNPLFIYGGSGLGKTHLLHSIGNSAQALQESYVIRYVSSEEFTNELINCTREKRMHEFKEKYRKVDILLIDDIQFLKNKVETMEEFFHTFNTLYNDQKQVVLTSDVHPKKLEGIEERLRTRFEWGLICDIQSPELETRCAILKHKSRVDNIDVPDDVINFIASLITRNIRELEGALTRVVAFASLTKQNITVDLARNVLKELSDNITNEPLSLEAIIELTATYFNITLDDIHSNSRSKNICYPRQIAMYLCRTFTDYSLPKIGKAFNKDHTTVMHSFEKIEKSVKTDPEIYNHIHDLSKQINRHKI